VRGHDVPEQHVLLEAELAERAVDDGGARLGRPGSGQLALRGEREPADSGAAVARRLADEDEARAESALEVPGEPLAAECRVGVLVVGRADARGGELGDEAAQPRIPAAAFSDSSSRCRQSRFRWCWP
jgi:hypothetical protein